MVKTQILMNKPVYLGLLILDLSKTAMFEFWYDCVKRKFGEKTKLRYMDTAKFVVNKKSKIIFTKTLQNMLKQGLTLQIMS